MKTLQKFSSVHASVHNHFNQEHHLIRRDIFKQNRSAALAERRQLAVLNRGFHAHFGDQFHYSDSAASIHIKAIEGLFSRLDDGKCSANVADLETARLVVRI